MKRFALAIIVCGSFLQGGCDTYTAKDNKIIEFSADKRLLLSGSRSSTLITCAEPSPDALSALALKLALQTPADVGASVGYQSSATYVGMKTEGIQLLRDLGYRTCEAYKNGVIDGPTYSMMMRRYEKYTLILTAIERIASTYVAPPVSVAPNVDLPDLGGKVDNANKKVGQSVGQIDDLLKKTTDPIIAKALTDLRANLDSLSSTVKGISSTARNSQKAASNKHTGVTVENTDGTNLALSPSAAMGRTNLDPFILSVASLVGQAGVADDLGEECIGLLKDKNPMSSDGAAKANAPIVSTSAQRADSHLIKVCNTYLDIQLLARARASNAICDPNDMHAIMDSVLTDDKIDVKNYKAAWATNYCKSTDNRGDGGVHFDPVTIETFKRLGIKLPKQLQP